MGRRRKFENRFEVIVETAARLFLEKGPQNTTMEEIAHHCDLGKATLYAEFKSKEDLMIAVIVRHIQQEQLWVRDQADKTTERYLAALKDILIERLMGIYDHANTHFHTADMFLLAYCDGGQEKIHRQNEEEIRIFADMMEKAAASGEMPPAEDYFYKAQMLWKALAGLLPPNVFDTTRPDFERNLREIVCTYLDGMAVKR